MYRAFMQNATHVGKLKYLLHVNVKLYCVDLLLTVFIDMLLLVKGPLLLAQVFA